MDSKDEKLNELLAKLNDLLLKQQEFDTAINTLRGEVRQLLNKANSSHIIDEGPRSQLDLKQAIQPSFPPQVKPQSSFTAKFRRENIGKSDFEKFIGENLISKIGILILVVGVAIGAKLAIDQELINLSPLTRIISGYLVGVALMGLAIKLKTKYHNFSAVLLSGAIAILYFITFAAYNYYQLIPQSLTFGLMILFTGFTVLSAIKYNKPVIAHIGLVGAYAIPFLLSNGAGNVVVLFTYIGIINFGILCLAFWKYWKSLFYLSFALTWIIFLGWRIPLDSEMSFLKVSMLFSGLYFFIFYATNLAYKTIKKEVFGIADVTILLLNSFIFYGIGYWLLNNSAVAVEMLGLFTLANAVIHCSVAGIIYKRKLADKNLFYFLLALVITFITLAIPVQLNGNWVTIFWAVEAAILFYFGRAKGISIYEKLSCVLIFLAFSSLLQDWLMSSEIYTTGQVNTQITSFINVGFLSSCIFIASFGWMFIVSRKQQLIPTETNTSVVRDILAYSIPTILLIVSYNTFRTEISSIFNNLYEGTKINISPRTAEGNFVYNSNYLRFSMVANYVYTLLFASGLTLLNLKNIKSKELAVANLVINLVVILAFLTHALYILSELREAYILQSNKYFTSGYMNLGIRYLSFISFSLLITACYELSKSTLFKTKFKTAFDYLLYIAILWLLSSELLHLLALNGLRTGYKLGISILWGLYALILVGLGLWKAKKYLRIGAIILFAVTLIKLFFYDLTSLNTISKTIVMVSLGALLLLISFLYNKYKHLIIDDAEAKN